MIGAAIEVRAADARHGETRPQPDVQRILGWVQHRDFVALQPPITALRLTTIKRQEARSVESGELDLSAYKGEAVMIEGVLDGGWLYEARIIDRGSPILTAVVRELFREHAPQIPRGR
jgi:hypothetical protein